MTAELPDDIRTFLAKANPSVMATVAKDGRLVAVATWYLLEPDGRILLNIAAPRVRLGHIRREPRIALDVIDAADWYSHVSLQLVATEIADDPDLADIDALSLHYGGRRYDDRDQQRVSVRAEITHCMGWGAFAPSI